MSQTLYELSEQTAMLLEMFEADEIDEQTFKDTVEGMGAIEKVENCCKILSQLNGEASIYKSEIERLEKAKKTIENNAKWLKSQIYNFYLANGSQKIKAGTFTVSARKSEFVDIPDDTKLPKKYLKITVSPDKTAIKNAIKNGLKVRGATISTRESVQIK